MPGASKMDTAQCYGLSPREVELTIKAMITMLQAGAKPDFEKLAKITNYDNAAAAQRNWWFTAAKLKNAGKEMEGETSGNTKGGDEAGGVKAVGKKPGKRVADKPAAAPAPKRRGRARKNAEEKEEQASDENLGGEV